MEFKGCSVTPVILHIVPDSHGGVGEKRGKEAGIEKPLFVLGLLIGESFASPTLI